MMTSDIRTTTSVQAQAVTQKLQKIAEEKKFDATLLGKVGKAFKAADNTDPDVKNHDDKVSFYDLQRLQEQIEKAIRITGLTPLDSKNAITLLKSIFETHCTGSTLSKDRVLDILKTDPSLSNKSLLVNSLNVFDSIRKSSNVIPNRKREGISLAMVTEFEEKVKRSEITPKKYDGTTFSKEELQPYIDFMKSAIKKHGGDNVKLNNHGELQKALADKSLIAKLK